MSEDVRGRARVLFRTEWLGAVELPEGATELARAIDALDRSGLCPVLDDGLAGGNAAVVIEGRLFVTPSGRVPGALDPTRVVEVVSFDPQAWCAGYRSSDPSIRPTSDTPLYDAILRELAIGWPDAPTVALHGHALDAPADAARLGVPISEEETAFSTPEDRAALTHLASRHPWPEHRMWIRRGHGFFVVGNAIEETTRYALSRAVQREGAEG